MKFRYVVGLTLATSTLLVSNALAEGIAVGAKIGSLGLGVEGVVAVIPSSLNFRVQANWLDYSSNFEVDDIDYDLDIDYGSIVGMLDYHPFENNFRISGGVVFNNNEVSVSGVLSDDEMIGDSIYSPEELGTLYGGVSMNDISPYVGLGFGNAVGPKNPDSYLSFSNLRCLAAVPEALP